MAAGIDNVYPRASDGITNKSGGDCSRGEDLEEANRVGTTEDLAKVTARPRCVAVQRSNGDSEDNPFQDDRVPVWEGNLKGPKEENRVGSEVVLTAMAGQQQVRVTMYIGRNAHAAREGSAGALETWLRGCTEAFVIYSTGPVGYSDTP